MYMSQINVPSNPENKTTLVERPEYSIFEEENMFSIINKCPPEFMEKLRKLEHEDAVMPLSREDRGSGKQAETRPWLELSVEEVRDIVRPTSVQNRLRMAFWREYEDSCRTEERMLNRRLYAGICSKEHFSALMAKTKNVAWMIQPIPQHKEVLEEALIRSTGELQKILEAPIYKPNGEPNTAVMGIKLKIHKMFEDRALGAVAQKIESKSVNVNVGTPGSADAMNIDVDAELRKLRAEVKNNDNKKRPEVIDVEVINKEDK